MTSTRYAFAGSIVVSVFLVAGCGRSQTPHDGNTPHVAAFKVSTSVQDIMRHQVEPAAEALWGSVSTTVTTEGVEEKQPRTDAQWHAVRGNAIALIEASNLLLIPDRNVLNEGQTMADEGVQGVLPATEVQSKIDTNRPQFDQFAHLLHEVSAQMLKAIDAKNAQGMLDAGEQLDAACESCHMTFWYPGQVIPEFPN